MSERKRFKYKPRAHKLDISDDINGTPILDIIADLAAHRHTKREAAALIGVSHETFRKFMNANPEVSDAWSDGKQVCKGVVRRMIFTHAKSDPTTARYLATSMRIFDGGKVEEADNPSAAAVKFQRSEAVKRILEIQSITIDLRANTEPVTESKDIVVRR